MISNKCIEWCVNSICFNFYGLKTKVNVTTIRDVNLLRFQYSTFELVNNITVEDITYYFLTSNKDIGFFEAIFDKNKEIEKTIFYKKKGNLKLYNSFKNWSEKVTPFPPFIFKPLVSKFIYFQGSSIELNNKAYAFLGKPFNGKSTLVNWMLSQLNNSKYLADDITIIDKSNMYVQPYLTSTGIRKDSKFWFNKITKNISNISTISEVTGKVEYHRIEDIYKNKLGKKSKIATFFILINDNQLDNNFSIIKITKSKEEELQDYRLPINHLNTSIFRETQVFKIKYNIKKVDATILISNIVSIIKIQQYKNKTPPTLSK